MTAVLERMQRQAALLDQPEQEERDPIGDVLELAALEQPDWKRRMSRMLAGGPMAADGIHYHDTRLPLLTADFATITLSTTSLMLWPSGGSSLATPAGYWTPGKKIEAHVYGKITTAATPGNLTVEIRYGTTDNGGTILATSAAQTLIAAQTSISWYFHFFVHARAQPGAAAGLFAWGLFHVGTAVIAAGQFLVPASAAAAVNVDTTASSGLNVQLKRSGSTVETATVQDVMVTSTTA